LAQSSCHKTTIAKEGNKNLSTTTLSEYMLFCWSHITVEYYCFAGHTLL
jgi:hypothetical protein